MEEETNTTTPANDADKAPETPDPIAELKASYQSKIKELEDKVKEQDSKIETYSKIIKTMPTQKSTEKEPSAAELIKNLFRE